MNPQGRAIASFSFIAFLLLIPAFIWHCRCKNVPAIFLIFWLLFNNLTTFVNSLIWSDENFYEQWNGKVYCDISIKLEAGSSPGKIAAISALALNLYMVLCANNPTFMGNNSKKKLIIDLSICLITPIFVMATNYIIQTYRYVIVRYRGCAVTYDHSVASVTLFSMWNLIWSIVAVFFAVLILYKYIQKRRDVKDILRCTNSGLNMKRFARLLIFSLLIILALAPVSIYYFISDASLFHGEFKWDEVHTPYWGTIGYLDLGTSALYDRFVDMGLSLIAFLLFGLGSDALKMYNNIFQKIGLKCSRQLQSNANHLSNDANCFSDQTRVNTNKSQSTGKSTLTNSSTMNEFNNQFGDLLSEDYEMNSPNSMDKKSRTDVNVFDLEKGLTNDITDSFVIDDPDTRDELNFIISQGSENHSDEGFGYNYQVKQNK